MNFSTESPMYKEVDQLIDETQTDAKKNLAWLQQEMHPYFFITMHEEGRAIATLATIMNSLGANRRSILADTEKTLILARTSMPGSLYDTLRTIRERDISYAHIAHSYAPLPGRDEELELQRFEFDRKSHKEIASGLKSAVHVPEDTRKEVAEVVSKRYPDFDLDNLNHLLNILWLNNPTYVNISPGDRIAQILWLYQQVRDNEGIHLDVEETEGFGSEGDEIRIMFAVSNPPQRDFLLQIMEVFTRLGIETKRTYGLTLSNGVHPVFLGTFYVRKKDAPELVKGTELFKKLRSELFNTQLLQTRSHAYQEFVTKQIMCGEDATLVNAFIAFCHTSLAHSSDLYDLEGVERAFHLQPELCLQLVELFRTRFDPKQDNRDELYAQMLEKVVATVEEYNTGHKRVDAYRRTIFRCCLSFIRNTLKTNFFVDKKQALSFRLDPTYLSELDSTFTDDLPAERPFRVTFFFGRYGVGYHIGFSDIARGGWRTLIANGRDDYVTCADSMFKENYVLAHTQHLKNKDIYEGGSKMVSVLNAVSINDQVLVNQRLYKLQYGFINAFLDIYVNENGKVKDPNVVDYYGDDEAIELGPDENMHDIMIETIATLAQKRGYILGIGIMSGKKVGINHKEFGVTSAGVVKFAEITMEKLGINYSKDAFTVKMTGGPGGDVAGNAMRLLLDHCPKAKINLILDGTGAFYDPDGADRNELRRIILAHDIEEFNPEKLHIGGFMLYRNRRRTDGMRELYMKVVQTKKGLEEQWISTDEFYREFNSLTFTVQADIFIPGGGRPETIDIENWQRFFADDGTPSARAIIEGANSFITPAARVELQKKGVIVMRDASANKCGVISSSYEIIANLVMSTDEFIEHKNAYVADVLGILERRAEDEARLIFKRYEEAKGAKLYTEISDGISKEINKHYAELFNFFKANPESSKDPLFQQAIYRHLPNFLSENKAYHDRIQQMPEKYLYAILAVEVATSMTYHGNKESDFMLIAKGHLERVYGNK
ncbi:glutamate dehydrogenase (NAD) [Desulfuromusa kysingii]|uniref:Glutamate dehydrogenase (NAD) n=1 Tax=Desulfuromusa kysingii TaxID=37625 RepID=A0A1H3VV66_9BACT|nr:NAD-glutamate dehydrogenase domain-containing protein [Desulfuromusa kysingii]SDZ78745.1 glutamate dehydrogenase (NAD) [Desulfuromusa kysingii]